MARINAQRLELYYHVCYGIKIRHSSGLLVEACASATGWLGTNVDPRGPGFCSIYEQ